MDRICLWSGPRNISTALMYSFAQREDTLVFDEPLYAHYLKNSPAREYHPGAQDVLNSMENDGDLVVKMMMGDHDKPIAFFKQMTHHLLDLDRGFMNHCQHIILTRNPKEMLVSFNKVIANPTMKDVGYADHLELLSYFEKNHITPVVLDSTLVLHNPEKVLRNLCDKLNIPFSENMLKWEAGARPEDGIWAKYWYDSVHKSTGFMPYRAKQEPVPGHLKPLLLECEKIYNELMQLSI